MDMMNEIKEHEAQMINDLNDIIHDPKATPEVLEIAQAAKTNIAGFKNIHTAYECRIQTLETTNAHLNEQLVYLPILQKRLEEQNKLIEEQAKSLDEYRKLICDQREILVEQREALAEQKRALEKTLQLKSFSGQWDNVGSTEQS